MRRYIRPVTSFLIAAATAVASLAVLPAVPAVAATAATGRLHPVGVLRTNLKVPARLRVSASAVLPASVDLRAGAPPVGDQGNVGSCVAWSIGYSLTGYYARSITNSGAPYAPLFLYMRSVSGTPGPETGLYPPTALRNEQAGGIDVQSDYWQGATNVTAWPTSAEINNATNYRISGWTTLFAGLQNGSDAENALKQSLAAGTPVSISIPVYSGFDQITSMAPYSSTSGAIRGYHMLTAYGYDDQGLIIRNSWSRQWGSSGDAELAWSFVNSSVDSAYTISGVTARGNVVPGAPTVGALSSTRAAAGTTVTIRGANLAGATNVMFGSTAAQFTNVADGQGTALAAVVPAHALGTVDVTVTNSAGISTVSAADKFTYLPSGPTITALSPSTVSTLGGTVITLTGSNLAGATSVKVGTTTVAARGVTADSLTFTAPARAAGSVDVSVTTAGGTTSTPLTYAPPPAPVISGISPATGLTTAATTVLLTGREFTGVRSVTAGTALRYTVTSPTTVSVVMPAHSAGSVSLVVTTAAGASQGATFTYVPPPAPAVTGLSTNSVTTTSATAVTATGTSFVGAVAATVDGRPAPTVRLSDSQLRITVPAHTAGVASIVVSAAGGTSTPTTITYVAPVPSIRAMSPASGRAAASAVITVTGVGFTGTTAVAVGSTQVQYQVLTDTTLRITVPATLPGSYPVTVTTAGGTGRSISTYLARN